MKKNYSVKVTNLSASWETDENDFSSEINLVSVRSIHIILYAFGTSFKLSLQF